VKRQKKARSSRALKPLRIGYARAENFISPGGAVKDTAHNYAPGDAPSLNDWALAGDWTVGPEHAALNKQDGGIVYRFHARDLHLMLGQSTDGKPRALPRDHRRRVARRRPQHRHRRPGPWRRDRPLRLQLANGADANLTRPRAGKTQVRGLRCGSA
jgi:hypothetical protein